MEEKHITLNDHYKLGGILGKGGWGTVYTAWDIHDNTFVAIKEVSLAQIPKALLGGIMSEITLLQSLDHPKIVRYIDSFKTNQALYIVLEYVENGSLEAIVKKFGNFPENLIAKYIKQVLEGLVYLHDQGVIHRDIKAANILTTKMGDIKLADFGVATRRGASDSEEAEPAGSPYWMAPEIIEMNGATTTSDIWSVGCTIIELVTGNPPYFELDTMPALFRIVQDDCPPIPDNISPALRDFLMTCFQKEPLLRSSAKQLLNHRWIASNTKKPDSQANVVHPTSANPQSMVEDYNKKLMATREEMKKVAPTASADTKSNQKELRKSKKFKPPTPPDSDEDSDEWSSAFNAKDFKFPGASSTPSTSQSGESSNAKSSSSTKDPKVDDEIWDDIGFSPVPPKKSNDPASATSATNPAKTTATLAAQPTKLAAKPAKNDDGSDEDWGDMGFTPAPKIAKSASSTAIPNSSLNTNKHTSSKSTEEDDNFDDLEVADSKASNQGKTAQTLASKLADRMKAAPIDSKLDDDPFMEFEDEESSAETDSNAEDILVREEVARLTSGAIRIIEGLNVLTPDEAILANLEKLTTVFRDYPSEKSHIISRTGVIPFVEMLQMSNPKIIHAVLKIINIIVEDGRIRESFSVMGGIATTLQYTNRKYSRPIRQEASVFIKQILSTGKKTMRMFIGARGLPVLVDFISVDEDYQNHKDLYLIGIECIYSIFTSNLEVRIPKNDFCRLFSKLALLPHLSRAFELVSKDPATKAQYSDKIADIFVIFSKGDVVVKSHFCEPDVLKKLFHVLPDLPPPIFLKVLKCIASLSMSPVCLEPLQNAGVIKALVPYTSRRDGQLVMETHQQLFLALYNLCRLDTTRQLSAAKAGLIPNLQWVITNNQSLKQFALPTLFDMARSKKIRDIMRAKDGVSFFLDLLKQQYPWQVKAMDSLSNWIGDDTSVEETIKNNLSPIIEACQSASTDEVLSGLFEHLNKMISNSPLINQALSGSPLLATVIDRLSHRNPLVRVQLLKILTSFYVSHAMPAELIPQLQDIVTKLESDPTIMVREMARSLMAKFKKPKSKSRDSTTKLKSTTSSSKDKDKEKEKDKDKDKDKKSSSSGTLRDKSKKS